MVKYRIIRTYRNFEHVKKILDYYKLKWKSFVIIDAHYFVFRCGDKRLIDILKLVVENMGMD